MIFIFHRNLFRQGKTLSRSRCHILIVRKKEINNKYSECLPGLPCMVVIPWIAVRTMLEDTLCWTTHNNPSLFLIIRIPIMISILVRLISQFDNI